MFMLAATKSCPVGRAKATAGLAHIDATVLTVNVAVVVLVPDTVVLAIEKQLFVSEGLPETAHATVPV